MKLIGGEILTYAKFDELILYLNRYWERIDLLEIYTNGAVIPKQSIQVTISDFGKLSVAKDIWIEFGKKI